MMNEKNRAYDKKSLVWTSLFLSIIFLVSLISAASSGFTSGSTAIVQTQYFSPSITNSFSSSYGSYLSTSTRENPSTDGSTMFDMQVFIPPLGCQPYVVRSDLLEEQNVPVFCKIVPLKINPGIDITRIDRINIQQKESNPYISGVGFHPAQAAIRSTTTLTSTPASDNLGYVVVVLKKQEVEKDMPDSVNVTLSATLEYGANYAYGIGQSEFYLPALTDSEFSDTYHDYGFFNGIGYLRVESMDSQSAVISIYSSETRYGSNMRKVFTQKIDLGKSSGDFYIPTTTGGQGVRISLKTISIPETKAKIRVNGQDFEVYRGGTFYNGKCTLRDLQSTGGGTGTASVYCGQTFNLQKQFSSIDMNVQGSRLSLNMYQKLDTIYDPMNDYYLVYTGEIPHSDNPQIYYAFIANVSKSDSNVQSELTQVSKKISSNLSTLSKNTPVADYQSALLNIEKNPINLGWFSNNVRVLLVTSQAKNTALDVSFQNIKTVDRPLSGLAPGFFTNALNSYDYVKTTAGSEASTLDVSHTYGEDALWYEYQLAVDLSQNQKANEILSRIQNDYPDSRMGGQTARDYLSANNMLSNEGSYAYYDKEDISLQLVSIEEAKASDASVELASYIEGQAQAGQILRKGELIYQSPNLNKSISLVSFTEDNVYLNYSCKTSTGNFRSGSVSGGVGRDITIPDCATRVVISKINFNKVAQVQLTPIVNGRSRETNFTFAIGIEKRAASLDLTPEEANKKMDDLTKQINQWRNVTEKLGKFIEAEKAACLVTSAYVNLKNLYAGKGGEATARTEVMKRWNEKCASLEFQKNTSSSSVEECIANNYKTQIEPEITATQKVMADYNTLYDEKSAAFGKNETQIKQAISSDLITNLNVNSQVSCAKDPATGQTKCQTLDKAYIAKILSNYNLEEVTSAELTDIYFNLKMSQNDQLTAESQNQYRELAYSKLKIIEDRVGSIAKEKTAASEFNNVPLSYSPANVRETRAWPNLYWNDQFAKQYNYALGSNVVIPSGSKIAFVPSGKSLSTNIYLMVLVEGQDKLLHSVAGQIYGVVKQNGVNVITNVSDQELTEHQIKGMNFNIIDATTYKNVCKNCDSMKVFVLDPYKGMPALLPFDALDGWYVQVKQTMPGLGSGNVKSYQDSGRVNTFWLCNIGVNGLIEQVGYGDDVCRRFDMYTGDTLDTFPGLTSNLAKVKVSQALKAIEQAQTQLSKNPAPTEITITQPRKLTLKVKSSEGDLGSKCTDFMSPDDCQLIFNVCDPVVCPNSRCDLGGSYKVDNVIQSGLVGSTVLCLPNFIGFHPNTGVVIPVCLTGINSGIQALTSIMEDYRDCLNESVTTGKTVGVCDMVYSVYVCDFFWKQVGPFTENLLKNLFMGIFEGKGDKGGAEYAFTKDAWANTEKSMQFMETSYGSNSKLAFGFKDITQAAVADVCKSPFSATYPDKFDTMLQPESPVQFAASFSESSYTDATVPPTSMYSVSYFIYAGADSGHYYQIYLKSPPTALGYIGKDSTVVASGYVEKGQKASFKKDLLDVSGFKELCVKIDIQEKCGFKSISTDFALDYAKNAAVADQAKTSGITKESECIAGSPNAGSLLNINIQQGVEQSLNPQLYNQGIIRVCSTGNPGAGVDQKRWTAVGYCDDKTVQCWIDENSVKNAITAKGIQNDTLATLEQIKLNALNQTGYFDSTMAKGHIDAFKVVYNGLLNQVLDNQPDTYNSAASTSNVLDFNKNSYKGRTFASLDDDVKSLSEKLIFNSDKADLLFYKGIVYGELARKLGKNVTLGVVDISATTGSKTTVPVNLTTQVTTTSTSTSVASSLADLNDQIAQAVVDHPYEATTVAAVCGFVGLGALTSVEYGKLASGASGTSSVATSAASSAALAENVIEKISLQSGATANVIDDTGKVIGTLTQISGDYYKLADGTAVLSNVAKINNAGEIVGAGGTVLGKLGNGAPLSIKVAGKATETAALLGEGALILSGPKVSLFLSKSTSLFSTFSKFAGKVLVPVGIAGTACDLYVAGVAYNEFSKAADLMESTGTQADISLKNLIDIMGTRIDVISSTISRLDSDKNLDYDIQKRISLMSISLAAAKSQYAILKQNYDKYSTNSDKQEVCALLIICRTGSEFTDAEYSVIHSNERNLLMTLLKLNTDFQSLLDDLGLSATSSGVSASQVISSSQSDIELLAKMIQGEQGVESREAKIAAGWVAVNRMKANTLEFGGNTLQGVITKPNAFQGYKSSNVPSSESLDVAKGILDGSIADNTGGALFFVNSAKDISSIVLACDPGYSKYGSLYAYHSYCRAAAAAV